MNIKKFIQNIINETKIYIEKYEQYSELSGIQKKNRVDEILKMYIESTVDMLKLNFVLKYIIKNFLIKNIPTITQAVFDLIKLNIHGITEFEGS